MNTKIVHREHSTGNQYIDDNCGVMLIPLPIEDTCGDDWSDHDWVTYQFIDSEQSDKFCSKCGVRPVEIPDGYVFSVMGKDGEWVEVVR